VGLCTSFKSDITHLLFGFTSRGAPSNTANHANSDVTSDGLRAQRVRRYTLFFSKPGGEAKYYCGVREFGHPGQGFLWIA